MIKVGVLTSSRADFGIYLPLLLKMQEDSFFELEIIAFGTHLSKNHGYTLSEIESYNLNIPHKLDTIPHEDSPLDISKSMGDTTTIFSEFWNDNKFDLVFALGDRYEMFSAVIAASPFNIKIAHLHAGETTLGAIDNAYRHGISLLSKILFVSHEDYKTRAYEIVNEEANIFNVGALSIDNLSKVKFLSKKDFLTKFNIDLNIPTILSTFHPETISFEKNEIFAKELMDTFNDLSEQYQIVITMPNSDTMGNKVREIIINQSKGNNNIKLIESFGMLGYLSCMKHCQFMLGNTSSGFIEANYFPKYVINIGDRQKGRIITENIISTSIDKKNILEAVNLIDKKPTLTYKGVYGDGNAADKIIKILKEEYVS